MCEDDDGQLVRKLFVPRRIFDFQPTDHHWMIYNSADILISTEQISIHSSHSSERLKNLVAEKNFIWGYRPRGMHTPWGDWKGTGSSLAHPTYTVDNTRLCRIFKKSSSECQKDVSADHQACHHRLFIPWDVSQPHMYWAQMSGVSLTVLKRRCSWVSSQSHPHTSIYSK